jgi:hypothetical protein
MRLFLFTTLALAFTCVPARPSGLPEPTLSPSESKVLEEYRLYCQPGRYFDEVRANLDTMQRRHPESAFLHDSAFMAEVHYMDYRYLRDGNGKQLQEWGPYVDGPVFHSIFAKYPQSREAWRLYWIHSHRSFFFAELGMVLAVSDLFFGLNSLVNEPPEGKGALITYRFTEFALPVGWIGSFIYGWISAGRKDRALDDAFFESNGQAIAKRLAKSR